MTRAGVLITGTEVLTGRVRDRNGPWLADRLEELGIDLAHIAIVGDRPADMRAALQMMAAEGLELIVTSGGLGPTADDLTTEVVSLFQGRAMELDQHLQERIAEIVRPLAERLGAEGSEALQAGNRKQATVPRGATILGPVGTAPGLVVPPEPPARGPTIVVLPGPPRELQPMWEQAVATEAFRRAAARAAHYQRRTMRLFGIAESQIAETLREAVASGVRLEGLEVTTCLRRGEVEVVTRLQPAAAGDYEALRAFVRARHGRELFSEDGSSIDEQVAALLLGADAHDGAGAVAHTIALAESCTGGLLAARLTDPPGASRYVLGGIVAYANEVKMRELGVERELLERHGAVSAEVARAMAQGVLERLQAGVGVAITGIAGPGGGSAEKPVGLVWLSVARAGGQTLTRSVRLPGGRPDVRDRATTVAMHLIRRALLGETDEEGPSPAAPEGALGRGR